MIKLIEKIKKNYLILVLMLFSLMLNILFSFSTPVVSWDESVYSNLGYDLSNNPLDYSVEFNGWSDWIPSGNDPVYSWPKMGFRAPLLPYTLSLLFLLNLGFLVKFFMPLIGALNIGLVYLLGRKLFNSKVGIYAASFTSLIPLYTLISSKILTDVYLTFFMLITIFSFWKGYEEGDIKYKILFGFFFALALLSRYTALWFIPIFFTYFLIRTKSLKFIFDKYLWGAILVFFGTLIPWFIYGYFEYGNILGAFIHGIKAATYWGGHQPWNFYLQNQWKMLSIIGIISLLGIGKIFYKKKTNNSGFLFLIIWIFGFLIMTMILPHKEERFILPVISALCLISGVFVNSLKKYKKLIFKIIILILIYSTTITFIQEIEHNSSDGKCFLNSMNYINNQKQEVLIVTDEFSVVYYYTKQETQYYPREINEEYLKKLSKEKKKDIYFLFSNRLFDGGDLSIKKYNYLEENLEKVFDCAGQNTFTSLYHYPSD